LSTGRRPRVSCRNEPACPYVYTRPHGITLHKTVIFIIMRVRTSNIARWGIVLEYEMLLSSPQTDVSWKLHKTCTSYVILTLRVSNLWFGCTCCGCGIVVAGMKLVNIYPLREHQLDVAGNWTLAVRSVADHRTDWDITILMNIWNENQMMSLFYSYIAGSLHVSGPQAHLQESSYRCSHNHWFSFCAALFACSLCCENSHQDRPQHTEHANRAAQKLNQWLCEQL